MRSVNSGSTVDGRTHCPNVYYSLTMAAIQNPLHVSEYSPDGKLLALISSDGKLKIWDIETNELKQEFVPKLHLSVPFTCFTWITVDNAAGGAKDVCINMKISQKNRWE